MSALGSESSIPEDPIVQYVVVRKDLKWPKGAMIAQACHASIAAVWNSQNDAYTQEYLKNQDSMHKVVLGAENEEDLREVSKSLEEANIGHKLWLEQPDNVYSCVASAPAPRSALKPFFSKFKLLR